MTGLAILLSLIAGATLWHTASQNELLQVKQAVAELHMPLFIVRCLFIVALIAFWPALVRACQRCGYFSIEASRLLIAARWRCLLWLLALELFLGSHVLASIGPLFRSSIA